MSARSWFALYPTDFLADVGHLGNTELGIYWRLLLVYYRDARPLPFDLDKLRRLAMTFSPEECRALEAVVAEFFVLHSDDDGTKVWRHKRADRELADAEGKHAAAVAKAERAAAFRWSAVRARREAEAASGGQHGDNYAPSNASSMPQAMLEQCQPQPQPQPQPHHPSGVVGGAGGSGTARASNAGKPAAHGEAPPPRAAARGARLNVESLPDEWIADCRTMRPDLDPQATFEHFADYWRAQPGAKGVKLDWRATWRNWCRGQRRGTASASSAAALPAWRQDQRRRMQQFAGYAAEPDHHGSNDTTNREGQPRAATLPMD